MGWESDRQLTVVGEVDVDTVEEIQQFLVAGELDTDAVDHWTR